VLGAEDDPMTRQAALHELIARTRDLPQVYVHAVQHGGHGAMSLVQPTVIQGVFERFFELSR
jgi:predicted alpha/beta-fold hydrolase